MSPPPPLSPTPFSRYSFAASFFVILLCPLPIHFLIPPFSPFFILSSPSPPPLSPVMSVGGEQSTVERSLPSSMSVWGVVGHWRGRRQDSTEKGDIKDIKRVLSDLIAFCPRWLDCSRLGEWSFGRDSPPPLDHPSCQNSRGCFLLFCSILLRLLLSKLSFMHVGRKRER